MKLLLERGADPSGSVDGELTVMHLAAASGYVDAINILRTAGASVDGATGGYAVDMPIHLAAKYGHPGAVTALLASGAEVNSIGAGGCTPLHYSCSVQRSQGLNAALETLNLSKSFIPFLCGSKHHETTDALILAGANVSARDTNGMTPVFVAAAWGHTDDIQSLLDGGADVFARSSTGQPPLFMAVQGGHADSISLLASSGAFLNTARDYIGRRTAIFLAAEHGHARVIELLHELGADLSSRDDSGCTPLFLAAGNGRITAVQKLVELGADPSCKNFKGETPWSYAKSRNFRLPPELKAALTRTGPKRESSPSL